MGTFLKIRAKTSIMRKLLMSTIANRKGRLEVVPDRVAFDGGETIKGVVVLHVTKAFECRGTGEHFHSLC